MTTILALPGSLRKGSFNLSLARAAAAVAPSGCTIEVGSIAQIPLYDGDVEAASGLPGAVSELKERVVAADALLLVTPEYNRSLPGVFKNAIDWLSRPPKDIPRVFGGRPVALMGATPGDAGTILAQDAWLPVLHTLRMRPWFGAAMRVSSAGSVFDGEGRLVDEDVRQRLTKFLRGFHEFIASSGGSPDR